jgi:ribosomal protein L7/L12
MNKCIFCGHVNPPSSDSCENCAAAIDAAVIVPTPQPPTITPEVFDELHRLLALDQKIEAIKVYREATGASLADAKAAVELVQSHGHPSPGKTPANDFERTLLLLLEAGRKIEAIKVYRERTGVGLKEAKDAVEALASRHGIRGTGCMVVVAFVLAALVAVGLVAS